ncbi:hypothetical protein [Amycolatopsis plumensis]|uniref:Phage-related minor tail protein n=1 Tax=Amycolatopsis plumensis TaxID=236508 RepID=A0ABV5TYB6_9PSEU
MRRDKAEAETGEPADHARARTADPAGPVTAPGSDRSGRPRVLTSSPRAILALQSAAGQSAVARLLQPASGETVSVQRQEETAPAPGQAAVATPAPAAPAAPAAPPPAPADPPAPQTATATAEAPVPAPEAGAPPQPATESGSGELDGRVAARRGAVGDAAAARLAQVRAAAAASGQVIRAAARTEQESVLGTLDSALERVGAGFASARDGINAQRRTKLAEVGDAAREKNIALDTAVDGHKAALLKAAGTRAQAARKFGEDEAARAVRECGTRAGRARAVGEQKAQQYQAGERGPRIAAEARELAGDAAGKIEAAGREVAAAVRKDGTDLAEKFLREGRDNAEKFEEARRAGHKKIEAERRTAADGIGKSADDAIDGLRRSADRLTETLTRQRAELGPALRQLGEAGAAGMRTQGENAAGQIGAQTAEANATIDTFSTQVAGALRGAPASAAAQVVAEADTQLASGLGEFDSAQEAQVSQAGQAFDTGAADTTSRISAGTAQVAQPVEQAAADFETRAADTMSQTNDTIAKAAKDATDGIAAAVTDTDRELSKAVTDADAGWGRQLDEGRAQAAKKVDDTLAAQEKVVTGLGAQIDKRAHEIQEESWLSRAARFLGGVLVGFLQELWDFVKVLAWIALIVVAVIVVAALIILAIGGIALLLEAIAAVAAFLAAAAGVIKVILIVLAVVGVIVLVAMAAWRIYQAWVRDDLSDYERGKLVGRSVFDILSILIPGRVLKFLGEARWLRALVESAGGGTRFVMLLIWARGDLVAVRAIVAEIRTIEEIMLVVRRTANITEFLELRTLVGETPRLIRLLRQAPNVAELRAVVVALGRDSALLDDLLGTASWTEVAQLVRNVTAAGGDAALIRTMVGKAGSVAEVNRLLGIVTAAGGDAPMLGRLLAGTANPAELTGLLTRLRNDAPLLDELIKATDDIAQLDKMLTALANDGGLLRTLLTNAGGKPGAAMLAELMDLAVTRGKAASEVADLAGQAAGNATEFQRLGNLTKLFHARTPAPTTPGPAMGPYSGSNMTHFLDEHTIAHYDFTKTGANGQSFWPAGHTAADVQAELQSAVNLLDNPGGVIDSISQGPTGVGRATPLRVLNGAQPNSAITAGTIKGPVRFTLPSGIRVQFGTQLPNTNPGIGQFFPLPGSPGVEHLSKTLLDAIAKIVG